MAYERVQLDDATLDAEHVNRIQTNVAREFDKAQRKPLRIAVTFPFANGDVRLYHNLGYPLSGYKIVRVTSVSGAGLSVFDGSPSTDPAKFANVRSNFIGSCVLEVD